MDMKPDGGGLRRAPSRTMLREFTYGHLPGLFEQATSCVHAFRGIGTTRAVGLLRLQANSATLVVRAHPAAVGLNAAMVSP